VVDLGEVEGESFKSEMSLVDFSRANPLHLIPKSLLFFLKFTTFPSISSRFPIGITSCSRPRPIRIQIRHASEMSETVLLADFAELPDLDSNSIRASSWSPVASMA
jgi:hypothetical protein